VPQEARRVYSLDAYARWVARQIWGDQLTRPPAQSVRVHADGWLDAFEGMLDAGGVLEVPALVITRWEFLGGLYRGNTEFNNARDAAAFARRFLNKVNPNYDHLHNLADPKVKPPHSQCDVHKMLRNNPLHGFTPAAIESADGSGVIAWWVAPDETGGEHLVVDDQGKLHVNGRRLCHELKQAMLLFAELLDADNDAEPQDLLGTHRPQERWLRSFWARFQPHGHDHASWMTRGQQHGIPG
jgi:hypothetical protein